MRTMALFFVTVSLATMIACGDGGGNNGDIDASAVDAGAIDANSGPPDADCVMNPVTNAQLMNACTDAERIPKNPASGCWYADGGLPVP